MSTNGVFTTSAGRLRFTSLLFMAGYWVFVTGPIAMAGASGPSACPSDCDSNGEVIVSELVTAVGIGQERLPLDRCPAADRDGDGRVRIDEMVAGVQAGLEGCQPPEATPTPTMLLTFTPTLAPTATPTQPATQTPTEGPDPCVDVPQVDGVAIRSELIATGFRNPLYVTAPPGDPERIFVVEQRGQIRIVRDGQVLATPFLDLQTRVIFGGEQGLLGLAFHPDYATNGLFFVDYTMRRGDDGELYSIVARFRVSDDPDVADPNSEVIVLDQFQPWVAHNGGNLQFGPQGNLYVSFGDGGQSSSLQNNAQDPDSWFGKVLRINVDELPYTIPNDNPFVGPDGVRDEIWAMGLRNPWRVSVDPVTGILYMGDVGESRFEEVNVMTAENAGANYGWCCLEATEPNSRCFQSPTTCPSEDQGLTPPTIVYEHTQAGGCSVTGGFVYRGCAMPDLRGTYFYGDFCAGFVRSFTYRDGIAEDPRDWTTDLAPGGGRAINAIAGFGQDALGELYICDHADGEIYKIVPAP